MLENRKAQAHGQRFWPRILKVLRADSLLIFDLGYTNFTVFAQLTAAHIAFITRAKRNLAYQVERYLPRTAQVHSAPVTTANWCG